MKEIRDELMVIAGELRDHHPAIAYRIVELAQATKRRPVIRKAPNGARVAVGEAQRRAIRAYAEAYPTADQARIAAIFNVNPGRVSEALRGKRQ